MWDELWIERDLTPRELIVAVAKAHGLSEGDIEIVEGIATDAPRQARVVVHRTRGAGQFAARIQLSGEAPADRRVFCARLATELGCKVLGDDGNINPLTFMQYEPGTATRVAVDHAKIENNELVVVGPYVPLPDDESHPTKPIRRRPAPPSHRATRGGQVSQIVNDYMVEALPRPPLVAWSTEISDAYASLQRLLGTLAYRAATPEETANVQAWTSALHAAFPDAEKAGWFVVELLEAAALVLAEPWDPERPALDLPHQKL